ncbi:MAG: hypothetical protein RL345_2152, partial [Chloroflexota bacterium]
MCQILTTPWSWVQEAHAVPAAPVAPRPAILLTRLDQLTARNRSAEAGADPRAARTSRRGRGARYSHFAKNPVCENTLVGYRKIGQRSIIHFFDKTYIDSIFTLLKSKKTLLLEIGKLMSQITEIFSVLQVELATFLAAQLPRVGGDAWWQRYVIAQLAPAQARSCEDLEPG